MSYINSPLTLTAKTIEELSNYRRKSNLEYSAACPFCGEGVDRFLYWPDVGNYWCRICDAKGFVDGKSEYNPAQIQAAKTKRLSDDRIKKQRLATKIKSLPGKVKYYHSKVAGEGREYWYSQGLTAETVARYRLGYSGRGEAIRGYATCTIPIIVNGQVVSIKHRLIGKKSDKYRPQFSGLGNRVFNADRLSRDDSFMPADWVMIVEGEIKCMLLDGLGFRVVAIPGASPGHACLTELIELLAGFDDIIIALDPGQEKNSREKIAPLFSTKRVIVCDLPGKPDDLLVKEGWTPEQLYEFVLAGEDVTLPIKPSGKTPAPYQLSPEMEKRRDDYMASRPPPLKKLSFEEPIVEPSYEQCPSLTERAAWTSQGKGKSYFYCNDPLKCELCRERYSIKLKFYLNEISKRAYIDDNGNAAYARPIKNDDGLFVSDTPGPGFWYGKIIEQKDRRSLNSSYQKESPGGFIRPEIYPFYDGDDLRYIVLSLAPFEDMQPVKLDAAMLQRISLGAPGEKDMWEEVIRKGGRSSLLFGPVRKTLGLVLPRYDFAVPGYLQKKGLVATIKAPVAVSFSHRFSKEDIFSEFDTKARSFDEIRLIFNLIGLETLDNGPMDGDPEEDYTIHYIDIVPEAKQAHLQVFNAGREGDEFTIKKYQTKVLPKVPKYISKGCVNKSIETKRRTMDLLTGQPAKRRDGQTIEDYYKALYQTMKLPNQTMNDFMHAQVLAS